MRFDLTDLRLFLNVYAAGTITGGAADSHMSLAAASERIHGMENSLGVPLLTRDRKGIKLTPAGHTLVHHAQLVLNQMEQLHNELGDYGKGVRGHIRMLCNTSALSEHLPVVLSRFLAKQPGISIDLEERTSQDIVDAIRTGVCEVGLVSDSVDLEGLETFFFRSDPLVLVVPREHVLAHHSAISLNETLEFSFVGLAEESALQIHLTQHARRLGKRLNYRIRLRSFDSVCRLVGLGVGIGIVPQAVAQRCARSAKVKRIPLTDAWASRNLVLCVRQLQELPMHTRQLIEHALDVVKKH